MCPNFNKQISQLDDASLCALVQKGSEPAFEEITKRYRGLILSISREYSYPGFDSGDFMQLGLMGLYSACKTYKSDSGGSFKNFAAMCIRRRYISLVRSLSSRKAIPAEAIVPIDLSDRYSEAPAPEALVEDKESDESFFKLIKNKLSFMELSTLKCYVKGMTYSEIAESLGLDTKAVDNALQRVRKKLLK